jgi:hypothetical protein
MILTTFLIALLVAVIMTALFVWAFQVRRTWSDGFSFFIIVFLTSWAGGLWIRPLNPSAGQYVPWFPEFVVGLIASLLMSSSMPAWGRCSQQVETTVPAERRAPPVSLLTPAYWVALFVLIVTIIIY